MAVLKIITNPPAFTVQGKDGVLRFCATYDGSGMLTGYLIEVQRGDMLPEPVVHITAEAAQNLKSELGRVV